MMTVTAGRRSWSSVCARLLALLGLATACNAQGVGSTGSAEDRRTQLVALRGSIHRSAVHLSDSNYNFYVTEVPRAYSIVVLFTTRDKKYGCAACGPFEDEFEILADSYQQQKKLAGSPSIKKSDIFFAIADYSMAPQTFRNYGIQQVPRMLFFGPQETEREGGPYTIDASNEFRHIKSSSAEAIAALLQDKTGVVVTVQRSRLALFFAMAVLMLAVAFSVKPIISNIDGILRMVRNRWLWFAVSLVFYTCSVSGGVYDIIRSPAPFYVDQKGKIAFFHPHSNVQFVFEGFIIGFMNLGASMALLILCLHVPKIRNPNKLVAVSAVSGISFVWLCYKIMMCYGKKNPWYLRNFR